METSTEVAENPVDLSEAPECMEVTPCIEPADFLDGIGLIETSAQNPYTEQMLNDGLSYADIDYFVKQYSDLENVKNEKVHCTVCNKHIGTAVETTERYPHPLLKVITCENCYLFYCSGEFETDKDGSELYCRWCGQGGQVFCCSKCPYVFCKKCIARNLGKNVAPQIECMEDWLCFNCNPCQISKLRATCWAITKYSEEAKKLAEEDPQLKSQNFIDNSTCCKSKRAASKVIGKELAVKKQKTEHPTKVKTTNSDSVEIVDSPPMWEEVVGGQDEVICTPDIMPYDDSPPGTPPEMAPLEYAPPPGQRGLDAPPNVPVVKKVVVNRPKVTPRPVLPKPVLPKPQIKAVVKDISPAVKVNNSKVESSKVVPTTQKISIPVQKGNVNSDEQWFGTAVIRSAEVTEYISSKVSLLAFMNSSEELTDEKKEEIYRTFQSHLDIAIAKLKNIKQNMTSSYKRLLSKQQIVLSGNTLKIVPASAIQAMQATPTTPKPNTPQTNSIQPKTPVQNSIQSHQPVTQEVTPKTQPARSSVRRRKSYSYIESTSEEENYDDDDDSSDDFMESKKKRKRKPTPKKNETPSKKATEVVKIVDVSSIVKNATPLKPTPASMIASKPASMPKARIENNKIILDVIDLIDDDSNEAADVKKDKNPSDEDKNTAEIDSDVEELLPDHLLEQNSNSNPPKTNKDGPIEIDDSDNEDDKKGKVKADRKEESSSTEEKDTAKSKEVSKKNSEDCKHDNEDSNKENKDSDLKIKKSKKAKVDTKEDDKESHSAKCDDDSQSSLPKTKDGCSKVDEESNLTNDENSRISTKSKLDDEDTIEKMDCDSSNLNEDTNMSEKVEKTDDNSQSCDLASETKSSQPVNDETIENTDSVTKSESEYRKIQNGECSNDSSKVPNDMSDNAVDCDINKNGIEETKKSSEEVENEDFEEILSGSVIKNSKPNEKYEEEFSKFVSNSNTSFDDDLGDEFGDELGDELSDVPGANNTLGFALGLKETDGKKMKNGKHGSEKEEPVENDLNVLRELAENCISSDMENNDSNA